MAHTQIDQITPQLFISGAIFQGDFPHLKGLGITAIVNLKRFSLYSPKSHFEYLKVPFLVKIDSL